MRNLWTKRNIMDYLSHPEESLDKNYNPTRQKYRKALRKMDMETKAQGGVVDWNYILNDLCGDYELQSNTRKRRLVHY